MRARRDCTLYFIVIIFVLLTDDPKCWIVRIEDISLLEACWNFTLVHFPNGKLLSRRSLDHCERRLDNSIFFRASRGCIVNLSHVKQLRTQQRRTPHFRFKGRKGDRVVPKANRSLPYDTRSLTTG
jgi:DNA-binding LytR/AlgR family response regulator